MNDQVTSCNLKPQQRDLTPVLRRPVEPAGEERTSSIRHLRSFFGPGADLRDECCICPTPGRHHQCAFSTASTDVTPAIIEPVIATSAGTPRGNSRLISEAMKIAAMGRAMTK